MYQIIFKLTVMWLYRDIIILVFFGSVYRLVYELLSLCQKWMRLRDWTHITFFNRFSLFPSIRLSRARPADLLVEKLNRPLPLSFSPQRSLSPCVCVCGFLSLTASHPFICQNITKPFSSCLFCCQLYWSMRQKSQSERGKREEERGVMWHGMRKIEGSNQWKRKNKKRKVNLLSSFLPPF